MQAEAFLLDRETALARVGGDWELLREVATLFLDHSRQMLHDVRMAIDRHDAAQLEMSAHSLKGSVSNFGASDATFAALVLEQKGQAQNWDSIEADYRNLSEQLERLRPSLTELAQTTEN